MRWRTLVIGSMNEDMTTVLSLWSYSNSCINLYMTLSSNSSIETIALNCFFFKKMQMPIPATGVEWCQSLMDSGRMQKATFRLVFLWLHNLIVEQLTLQESSSSFWLMSGHPYVDRLSCEPFHSDLECFGIFISSLLMAKMPLERALTRL